MREVARPFARAAREFEPARLVPHGLGEDLPLRRPQIRVGCLEPERLDRWESLGRLRRIEGERLEHAPRRGMREEGASSIFDPSLRQSLTLPAWITEPRATKRSLDGDAGSRKLMDRSEDRSPIPLGSVVNTAPARAASATKPSVPRRTRQRPSATRGSRGSTRWWYRLRPRQRPGRSGG